MRFDLTIITATVDRPKDLYRLLEAAAAQRVGKLFVEHLIVLDGPGQEESVVVNREFRGHPRIKRRIVQLETTHGEWGAKAKDVGISEAHGDLIVFWDDDNWFFPHALSTVAMAMARARCDVGVFPVQNRMDGFRILPRWDQGLCLGNLDTACLAVRQAVARRSTWYDQQGKGTDWRFFARLANSGAVVKTFPHLDPVGVHL